MATYKVVVIDDKEAHAQGLAELLSLAGFESSYTLTGREGLEYVRSAKVDAVLLDVNLPDMTGYEVCRILRTRTENIGVAVVFHTAEEMSHERHGGDAFLTYPVETEHLVQVLLGCISRRQRLTDPSP